MKRAKPVSRVDNAQVRVTEWQFEPGAATGHHRHEFDYVVVPLVDGLLRLIAADGDSSAELRRASPISAKPAWSTTSSILAIIRSPSLRWNCSTIRSNQRWSVP